MDEAAGFSEVTTSLQVNHYATYISVMWKLEAFSKHTR